MSKARNSSGFFPLLAILLLTPWPIAYAYTYDAEVTAGQEKARIAVADPSAMPSFSVFGRAIGGIDTPGALFYVDATENPIDIQVVLYLTNTKELSRCYSYLILEVGIYAESDAGEWEKADTPDTFITLRNGQVSFILLGYTKYKLTIDGGSFYCIRTEADGGSVSPQFYLTADKV